MKIFKYLLYGIKMHMSIKQHFIKFYLNYSSLYYNKNLILLSLL